MYDTSLGIRIPFARSTALRVVVVQRTLQYDFVYLLILIATDEVLHSKLVKRDTQAVTPSISEMFLYLYDNSVTRTD